ELKAAGLKAKNRELLGKVRQTKTSEERIADLETELKHFKLTTPLREMALKAGIFPERVDMALLELEKRFALNDDGEIVTLDERGNATDIKPQKFLSDLYVHQRPWLYAASSGGGSGAQNHRSGSSSNSNTMTRDAFEKLSPQQKMEFSKGGGVLTDGY